jgi:hypothetical protein
MEIQIQEFNINGKVVNLLGEGISQVTILLDGEIKAKTDSSGHYTLEKIKGGIYTIQAEHEHLFFEPLTDIAITVLLEKIPDLVFSKLHLCGKLRMHGEGENNRAKKQ